MKSTKQQEPIQPGQRYTYHQLRGPLVRLQSLDVETLKHDLGGVLPVLGRV
jgi:hypothetical protein